MRQFLIATLLTLTLAAPAAAMSIRGVELSPTDAARVDRQCDVLRLADNRSLAETPPEEPPAGTIVSDPASYWADRADGTDAALTRGVNLDTITRRECRDAGFYDN